MPCCAHKWAITYFLKARAQCSNIGLYWNLLISFSLVANVGWLVPLFHSPETHALRPLSGSGTHFSYLAVDHASQARISPDYFAHFLPRCSLFQLYGWNRSVSFLNVPSFSFKINFDPHLSLYFSWCPRGRHLSPPSRDTLSPLFWSLCYPISHF